MVKLRRFPVDVVTFLWFSDMHGRRKMILDKGAVHLIKGTCIDSVGLIN